ncbi:hypothetical protein AB2567_29010, partial [Klebsiella michiganensis]|uniref:hypothetical protein n=1 Tax=Klebsiella michiganensis TaxID=1134687 RepID=UPI003464CA37
HALLMAMNGLRLLCLRPSLERSRPSPFKYQSAPQRSTAENPGSRNNKSLQAGSVLPSGAYLQRLHHSDGSSSQGKFNISDLNDWDKMID